MENNRRLKVSNLGFQTPLGVPLAKDLSFELSAGELCLVSGPNGAGKSTLLKVVLGDRPKQHGTIECFVPVDSVAYLPQLDNMEFSLPATLRDVVEISLHAHQSLEEIGALGLLEDRHLDLNWATASGGERKRALLTRVLLGHPRLLLLDEPMNHLDRESRTRVIEALHRYVTRPDPGAVLMVSHEGLTPEERTLFSFKEVTLS